jgi:predicted HTH transcriptional regulator
MAEDLYHCDLKSISGTLMYEALRAFTLVDRPIDERPREGYLLDFKEDLNGDSKKRFLHSAASFANTFGGLLVLGVSEKDGRPEALVGLTVSGELKTQVASLIASNLFPCPPLDIAECSMPKEANRKLAVIRVRETAEVCLVARKGESHPVYVRIEDQSEPADASQLRSVPATAVAPPEDPRPKIIRMGPKREGTNE